MKKNLIYITGNDSYGVELEVLRWIRVFEEKYGELNIERIRLENRGDFPLVRDNLTTTGLFAEKRLFIFSGWIDRKTKNGGLEEILEPIGDSIPDDHFCLFHNISKKEEWLLKWLTENADNRKIDTLWSIEKWGERFDSIPKESLQKILTIYRNSEANQEEENRNPNIWHTIATTLECASLNTAITITDFIHIPSGGKIFDFIDLVLSGKIQESIVLCRKILETTSPVEFLISMIGLLRGHLYIKFLANQWKTENDIAKIIKIHPFVLKKSLSWKLPYEKLAQIYQKLVKANMAYKSGKWLQDVELWRIFSIEIALMGLKKQNIS